MPNFILPIFFVIFIFVCTAHAEDGENTGELNIESKTELYSANLYIKAEDNDGRKRYMNILLICNNYDSIRDGIGKYAKIIAEELKKREAVDNVFYTTGYTDDSSRLKMLFSFRCFSFD